MSQQCFEWFNQCYRFLLIGHVSEVMLQVSYVQFLLQNYGLSLLVIGFYFDIHRALFLLNLFNEVNVSCVCFVGGGC